MKEMNHNSYLADVNMKKTKGLDTFSKVIGNLAATYLLSKCDCYITGRPVGFKGV